MLQTPSLWGKKSSAM